MVSQNIQYAIDKELISLGFSGHSYLYFDEGCMSQENTIKYLEDGLTTIEPQLLPTKHMDFGRDWGIHG